MDKLTSYNLQVLETINRNNQIQTMVLVCYPTSCARFPHESLAGGGRRQVEQQTAGCGRSAIDGVQVAAGGGLRVGDRQEGGRARWYAKRGGSRHGRRTDHRGRSVI
jgi:hypothetical protein